MCDNRRFLRHVLVDLDQYALFDIDVYGFPHEYVALICQRLQWTRFKAVGFVLTDCSVLNSARNDVPNGLLVYLGIARHRGGQFWHSWRQGCLELIIQKAGRATQATIENMQYTVHTRGSSPPLYGGYLLRHQPS